LGEGCTTIQTESNINTERKVITSNISSWGLEGNALRTRLHDGSWVSVSLGTSLLGTVVSGSYYEAIDGYIYTEALSSIELGARKHNCGVTELGTSVWVNRVELWYLSEFPNESVGVDVARVEAYGQQGLTDERTSGRSRASHGGVGLGSCRSVQYRAINLSPVALDAGHNTSVEQITGEDYSVTIIDISSVWVDADDSGPAIVEVDWVRGNARDGEHLGSSIAETVGEEDLYVHNSLSGSTRGVANELVVRG